MAALQGAFIELLGDEAEWELTLAVARVTWHEYREVRSGDEVLDRTAIRSLADGLIDLADPGTYTPANGAIYPDTTLGNHFRTIACACASCVREACSPT